ncbi:MAG: hypothetical protein LBD48_04025 [Treponema sp.]|jgi:hypothetical protein|nr:hypothetical protein [Treponema sp.]
MRVPETYYDEIFSFNGQWDMPSRCGLKIIRRARPVVLVTELYQDNPGTSVTAAGKSLAQQICAAKSLRLDEITYIECSPATNSKLSFYDEELFEACFSGTEPVYRRLSVEEARSLF